MKKKILYAVLGIGIIGVCFSLVMFRGKDTAVIEEPTIAVEQVQEEVVDINDKLPDTELDIEVEEVVENEVKAESIGVSEEPSGSIVEFETSTESIVETTELVEEVEAPAVEEPVESPIPVVESVPEETPAQEQSKPIESTEVQPVVSADVGRSDLQQNTIAELEALFGPSNTTQAPPSTNHGPSNETIAQLKWE